LNFSNISSNFLIFEAFGPQFLDFEKSDKKVQNVSQMRKFKFRVLKLLVLK
jgi:hypothetical protein